MSLIELLIVLALISVFSYLGWPIFKPLVSYSSLQNDAWRLLSDLRSCRQLAVVEHLNYRFSFNVSEDSYTIEQRDATTDNLIATISTVPFENDLTQATDTTFRPKGEATAGSTIVLKGKSSSDTITITIFATTGLAKISS